MSIMVDGIGLPRNGCIGCYFRTAKYCGLKESNDYVWSYAEKGTRPDDCPITEVIRCKDCKYWKLERYVGGEGMACQFMPSDGNVNLTEPTAYCCWAERIEE